VLEAAGDDFVVGYHLMSDERMPDGWTIEDAVRFGHELEHRGVHFVIPVAATFEALGAPHNAGLYARPKFQHHDTLRLAAELGIPVLANGRLGDPVEAEAVLRRGEAAAIGLARPLLSDPDWYLKVQDGRAGDLHVCSCDPPTCLMTQLTGSICNAWSDTVKQRGFLGYDEAA
jgi:2,4-dienoyl-CoA reductase (NADPH2)